MQPTIIPTYLDERPCDHCGRHMWIGDTVYFARGARRAYCSRGCVRERAQVLMDKAAVQAEVRQ